MVYKIYFTLVLLFSYLKGQSDKVSKKKKKKTQKRKNQKRRRVNQTENAITRIDTYTKKMMQGIFVANLQTEIISNRSKIGGFVYQKKKNWWFWQNFIDQEKDMKPDGLYI